MRSHRPSKASFFRIIPLLATTLGPLALGACASEGGQSEDVAQVSLATGSAGTSGAACKSTALALLDVRGDVREIWKGLEQPATGKRAAPNLVVTFDFNANVTASSVVASFVPTATDGSCGSAVAATAAAAVVPLDVWGQVTTDVARLPLPSPLNVLARDQISGIVSAGGPIAAGKDITLSSLTVNGTVREPVGLIAGGKVTLTNGSVAGNVTYGVASTFPQSVSITGTKTLLPFDPVAAFTKLESMSTLLDKIPVTGSATLTNGTLKLAGTKSGVNAFRISAEQLQQATNIQISAPSGAAVLIGTSGSAVDLQNKGITLTGITAGGILWNFPAAGAVTVNSVALQGSVLAPRARFQFGAGSINGTVVARSFVGSGSGSLIHAPLNATLLLGASAPSSIELTPAAPLTRGCTYQLQIPSTQPLNAGGACLGTPFGVTFTVADNVSSPAGRELVNVEMDLKTSMLRRFRAKSGVNTPVADVWSRYEDSPGISATELVAVGTVTKSSTIAAESVQAYQQYTQGYPVLGFGYFVASENGLFRSANGRVMPGIASLPQPTITAATALQKALTYFKISTAPWVAKPSTYQAPTGTLIVAPTRPLPKVSDFALVWSFQLGGKTGIGVSTSVLVDAATGAVLADNPSKQPATLNPLAKVIGPTLGAQVKTLHYQDQPITTTDYKNPDGSIAHALTTDDVFDPAKKSLIATAAGVYKDAAGNMTGTESYLIDPTPSTPWDATDYLERGVAGAHWGLGLADTFMKTLGLSLNQQPWNFVDGTGTRRLILNYVDAAHVWQDMADAQFHPAVGPSDKMQIFVKDEGLVRGVDVLAHEYGHALLDGARRAAGLTPLVNHRESASILEGFADLFAIGFNQYHPELETPWYCHNSYQANGVIECLSNTQLPFLSSMVTIKGGQPEYYHDDHYSDFIDVPISACANPLVDTDNCGSHWNSTMISHWGYLLAAGSQDLPSTPCDLILDPIGTDPAAGLKLAVELSMGGIQRLGAAAPTQDTEATFYDFRDATLQIAQEGLQSGRYSAAHVAQVELAWAAMALPPQGMTQSLVQPAEGARSVNPWTVFMWPASCDGQSVNCGGQEATSWDFQLADGPWETNVKFDAQDITKKITREGKSFYTVSVSLPYDTDTNFYWRVRPHSTDTAWLGCYPVHTFKGTSKPSKPEEFKVEFYKGPENTVLPGRAGFSWKSVPGATEYELDVASVDPECKSGPGVLRAGASHEEPRSLGYIDPLEAAEHYFVDIHAVGPPGFDRQPTTGDCVKFQIDTAPPAAPTLGSPPAVMIKERHAVTDFSWTVFAGTAESHLTFYNINDDGTECTNELGSLDVVSTPCPHDQCLATFEGKGFPKPNLTGYCWQVDVAAKNGKPGIAPSETRKLGFYQQQTVKQEPGIQRGLFEGLSVDGSIVFPAQPMPLPGASYGEPVTLSWDADPEAHAYRYRVWPFGKNNPPFPVKTVDPSNCRMSGIFSPELSDSCSLPDDISADGIVTDPVAEIDDGSASSGRYCWNVWPVLADPQHPNKEGPRQPFVDLDTQFCYTSGPSVPEIVVDNPPGPKFSPDPITGHIKFDYVPDGQFAFKGVDAATGKEVPEFVAEGTCEAPDDAYIYQDIHDCEVPFSLTPTKGKKYKIVAETWNSDEHPPVMDAASQLPDAVEPIEVASCGKQTELCCDATGLTKCDNPKNRCDADHCVECGKQTQLCCNTAGVAKCEVKRNICNDTDHCVACGAETQDCCDSAPACNQGLECNAKKCKKPVCPPMGEPDLLTLSTYQNFCPLDGGSADITTDLVLPTCTLDDTNVGLLVTNKIIPCSSGLAFLWPEVPGATLYEVYVRDYYSGTSALLGTSNTPGFSYPSCTINKTTDCVIIPASPAAPSLYTFMVRAVGGCGQKGPAGVGMLALRNTCN